MSVQPVDYRFYLVTFGGNCISAWLLDNYFFLGFESVFDLDINVVHYLQIPLVDAIFILVHCGAQKKIINFLVDMQVGGNIENNKISNTIENIKTNSAQGRTLAM